jgi:hypothetical protein
MCVQGVGAGLSGDGVLFVERSSELILFGEPKPSGGGIVKARVNSPQGSEQGYELALRTKIRK